MRPTKTLEQQIAVFGESGSGKTVLLSSFYGAMQEADFDRTSLFNLVADDISQGIRLHSNYLGMRNAGKRPAANRFTAASYAFSAKFKDIPQKAGHKGATVDALRLVWHDYPGEWFESSVSGPEEAQRRVDTFRTLLSADVALVLVDGQRLLEEAGQEEKYLKLLLTNLRNGLLSLKDDLLPDGKRLVECPRIWVLALSKSDLLPDMDVYAFRDLLIEKAGEDVDALRRAVGGLVEASDALSIGEDFVLLSSARFDAEAIRVSDRVGVDLIHPMAAILPLERHARWTEAKDVPGRLADALLGSVDGLAAALVGRRKVVLRGPAGLLLDLFGPDIARVASDLAGDRLKEHNAAALRKREHVSATLSEFRLTLERAEEEKILLRSAQ